MSETKITVRVDERVYQEIVSRAKESNSSISDVVKKLLVVGLNSSEQVEFGALIKVVSNLEAKLIETQDRLALATAANRFYGHLSAFQVRELCKFLVGKEASSDAEKVQRAIHMEKLAAQYARRFIDGEEDALTKMLLANEVKLKEQNTDES